MSFTQDELQAFNAILDQKLSVHRRELEYSFDQRMQGLRRDLEQRLMVAQQDLQQTIFRQIAEQQSKSNEALVRMLDDQQVRMTQSLMHDLDRKRVEQQAHDDDLLENSLAAQLLAFEQLINQRQSERVVDESMPYTNELAPDFGTIEVQTEIPWDDLVDLINQALDERLLTLRSSLLNAVRDTERNLSVQMNALRDILLHEQRAVPGSSQASSQLSSSDRLNDMQDVFKSIEQLERLIESVQMAMAANSALISNRLYHHQQLPIERAHVNYHAAQESVPLTKDSSSATPEQ